LDVKHERHDELQNWQIPPFEVLDAIDPLGQLEEQLDPYKKLLTKQEVQIVDEMQFWQLLMHAKQDSELL